MNKTELLYQMVRIRTIEEEIAHRYSDQEMRCPTHLSTGQEAVPAAISMIFTPNDYAVSTHRGHAHYLGKGGNLKKMIAEIYGKVDGCSRGRGGSMHLIDTSVGFMGTTAIVGNSIPIGVGLALAIKLDNSKNISCVFVGDGAIEEGVFYEAANYAAVKKLPILFICDNNLYSVYSPMSVRQPKNRCIFEMVNSIGVPSREADGNDVIEVYKTISASVKMIRDGSGPQFLEFSTYRWREHCGPNFDNDLPYRNESEFLLWKGKDPISILLSQLLKSGEISDKGFIDVQNKINEEVKEAFDYAKLSPYPDQSEAYIDKYY